MKSVVRKVVLKSLVPAFVISVAMAASGGASAALLFSENFEGHANGATVQTANGWTGGNVNVNDSTHFGGSRVLDGTDATGTVDGFGFIERNLGGTLAGSGIHTMSVDVYGQTSSLPSHNNGMGLSASGGANAFSGGAYWSVLYDLNNISGNTGYIFDARNITGGASDFFLLNGPFNSIQTMEIVLDGLAGEVYGVYDFGGGATQTTHYAVTAAQIAAIDQVFGFFDFRSANPGGTFASTGLGTQFGGAQWDNISVTGTFAAIPEPSLAVLFGLGIAGLAGARRYKSANAG